MQDEKCYACGRNFRKKPVRQVWTLDGQMQYVGSDCFKLIKESGVLGYQPPRGGPVLFIFNPVQS